MSYFTKHRQHPGFKYFSVSFGILLVFIFIGISGLVFMYKVTNLIYKLIETANLAKEIFFIADTVHSKIGKTNMAFLQMQYKAINYANDHHKEISRIYYTNNYTYTVILFIATILSAIMLFIIANRGLQSAEPLAKIFIFSFFSISIKSY